MQVVCFMAKCNIAHGVEHVSILKKFAFKSYCVYYHISFFLASQDSLFTCMFLDGLCGWKLTDLLTKTFNV